MPIEYQCETCGKVCGIRQNPKETWYRGETGESLYYCKRTCSPAGCRNPSPDRRHRDRCYYCLGEAVFSALSR